ncbi:MAG: hypothetical protein WBP61_00090 [Nocardioides sp.]
MTPAPRHRARFDHPVLVSNLASGALWLLVPAALGAWPLSLIGGGYVLAGSLFLAAVYAGGSLSTKQEALTWVAPWLVAIALWALILTGLGSGGSAPELLIALGVGTVVATPCYVAWQAVALAIRQFMSWRHGTPVEDSAPKDDDPVRLH